MGRQTTNGDIYNLMNDLRKELKSDIRDVSSQVEDLRKTVSENEVKQTVSATKLGMLITTITIIASAITTIVVDRITGRTLL